MKDLDYTVEPLYSGHHWYSEMYYREVFAIKRCKACTILLYKWKSNGGCDKIRTFKSSIIVLFDLDYHVDLSFLFFIDINQRNCVTNLDE